MADESFEKPFRRARRALRHLWHINRGEQQYSPETCDGCKEIHHFLTDQNYRGDEHYPVGVESDPDLGPGWKLGPNEMETVSLRTATHIYCDQCQKNQPLLQDEGGDLICGVCKLIVATVSR